MTDPDDTSLPQPDDDLIDGHSVEELDAYLTAGRQPRNPSIENSPSCLLYLRALSNLRNRSWGALTREAERERDRDDRWITGLIDTIKDEVRAGRDIPIRHPDPTIRLTVTEAALQGLIRDVADSLDGLILGRTVLSGDVTLPDEPITVSMTVAVEYGLNVQLLADQLRSDVFRAIGEHTDLRVTSVGITVDDVFTVGEAQP